MKKIITWDPKKNEILKNDITRWNVCFEDCVSMIEEWNILAHIPNPSVNFGKQMMYILNIRWYAYAVAYVENEKEIFLKTMYPHRKYTKLYLN